MSLYRYNYHALSTGFHSAKQIHLLFLPGSESNVLLLPQLADCRIMIMPEDILWLLPVPDYHNLLSRISFECLSEHVPWNPFQFSSYLTDSYRWLPPLPIFPAEDFLLFYSSAQ